MALTPIVRASLFEATNTTALASYPVQSGDLNATFARDGNSTSSTGLNLQAFGLYQGSNGNDFYHVGSALTSGQDQIDVSMDLSIGDLGTSVVVSNGLLIGSDATSSNYLTISLEGGGSGVGRNVKAQVTNQVSGSSTLSAEYTISPSVFIGVQGWAASFSGTTMTVTTTPSGGAIHVGDKVGADSGLPLGLFVSALGTGTGGNGTYTLNATSGSPSSVTGLRIKPTATLTAQIRGTAGSYTMNILVGPKYGSAAMVASNIAVPGLVMVGRNIGVFQGSGGGTEGGDIGIYPLNYLASVYSSGGTVLISPPTVATGSSAGSVTITGSAATGGTAPYSYQLQRAPQSGGVAGTFANVGSALSSPSTTDSGLTAGSTYYYQWVVTDSASGSATSSSTSYVVPVPDYTVTTNPTSLTIVQGASGSLSVTISPTGGYSGSPAITALGLPSGVMSAVSGSTVTLTASGSATAGSTTIQVHATDGTTAHNAAVTLVVNAASGTGTAVYPTPAQVLAGVTYGPTNNLVGTYAGGGFVQPTTTRTVSVAVKTLAGLPVPNQTFQWTLFDQVLPQTLGYPVDQGASVTTDVLGNLLFTAHSAGAIGAPATLVLSNTNGTPTQSGVVEFYGVVTLS